MGATFCLFFILSGTQLLATLIVKIYCSKSFTQREDYLNKFLHLVQSLSLAFPFKDWDRGKMSVKEYKNSHKQTNIEMAWSFSINHAFSLFMLLPLWYTGIYIGNHLMTYLFSSCSLLCFKGFPDSG